MLKRYTLIFLIALSTVVSASPAEEVFGAFAEILQSNYVHPQNMDYRSALQSSAKSLKTACARQPECAVNNAYPYIRNVLNVLNDPHTEFLFPEAAELYIKRLQGTATSFFGLQYRKLADSRLLVLDVAKNGAAEKAGLQRFDVIESIDLTNKTSAQELRILREGQNNTLLFTPQENVVTYEPYLLYSHTWASRLKNIALLRIPSFIHNSVAAKSVHLAVQRALDSGAEGMIVDLRNNPGGAMDQCLLAASAFVKQFSERWVSSRMVQDVQVSAGDVVWHVSPEMKVKLFSIRSKDTAFWGKPLVVLINRQSASCAEYMAREIQKAGVGIIIGEDSYGVGNTATNLFFLPDKSLLMLSSIYVADVGGKPYDTRVKPNIYTADDPEKIAMGCDDVLEKGFDILQNLMTQYLVQQPMAQSPQP